MTGPAPTAHQLYFPGEHEPRGHEDPERQQHIEEAFFGAVWIRNGTSKLTYRRRFDDLNDLVRPLLPADRPLEIMDIAVSSGVSTGEWLDSLERSGIECRMVAGDAVIDAFLISAGDWMRALVDRTGFLMHLELAGRAIRLPPPRRCGARLHLHLFNALRAASAPLLRSALRRLQRSSGGRRRLELSCRPLKLVSPGLAARGSIEWVEDDILRDGRYLRRFHAVRVNNLLNHGYFDTATLERMLANLRERLRPRGLLIVCRTLLGGENHATVFRLEPGGRFSAVARLNQGSEIAALVLGLPAGSRSEPAAAEAVRPSSATGC